MPTNEQRRQAAKRKLERQLARREARAKRRRWYAVAGSAAAVVLVIGLVVLITTLGRDGNTGAAAPPDPEAVPSSAVKSALPEGPAIPQGRAPALQRPQPLPATVPCHYPPSGRPPAKPVQPPPAGQTATEGTVAVTLDTSVGTIPLTLDRALGPCAVNSFASLAKQGFYNNTPCHRLTTVPTLQVLQCGDPSGTGRGGPGYSFADETFAGLRYGRGYLAMANSGPDTNGSQFFMIYGNAQLPPNYTVFGTIATEGLQVIDEVARAGIKGGGSDGAPNTPVQITRVTVGR